MTVEDISDSQKQVVHRLKLLKGNINNIAMVYDVRPFPIIVEHKVKIAPAVAQQSTDRPIQARTAQQPQKNIAATPKVKSKTSLHKTQEKNQKEEEALASSK